MTTLVRRVFPLVALGLVMIFAVRNLRLPGVDNDTWFHLRMGSEFRSGWSVGDPGHLSPYDTADWVATQWLSQLGMVWVHDLGGIAAVLWITGFLTLVMLAIIYLTCREVAAPLPAAFATAACFVAAAPGISARPQLMSYVLLAVTSAAWVRTVADGRARWWLVPLTWAWAALHGMWPVGVLLGIVVVAGLALGRTAPRPTLLRLAAVPALSSLVVLLTPTGIGVYTALAAVGSRASYFEEWRAPDFRSPDAVAVAAMAAVVLVVGLTRRRLSPVDIALLGLAVAWALYSVRTGPVAAIILAPLLAAALQQFLPTAAGPSRYELVTVGALVAACCVGLALVAPARAGEDVVPPSLDQRLDALPPESRLLNEWDIGPWFLWRHPELWLVSHGYGDVFTESELARNASIMRVESGWREEVEDLEVDYALVRPDTSLGYALDGEGWTEVYGDEDYRLLAPPAAS